MIDPKDFVRITLISLLLVGIVGYAYFRSRDAIWGTKITASIHDGQTLESNLLTLTGNAPHTSLFTVNNRELLLDKNGDFIDTLLLHEGYNIITLEAKDKFGRIKNKVIRLFVKSGV